MLYKMKKKNAIEFNIKNNKTKYSQIPIFSNQNEQFYLKYLAKGHEKIFMKQILQFKLKNRILTQSKMK